jgi:hypothetical protein
MLSLLSIRAVRSATVSRGGAESDDPGRMAAKLPEPARRTPESCRGRTQLSSSRVRAAFGAGFGVFRDSDMVFARLSGLSNNDAEGLFLPLPMTKDEAIGFGVPSAN